MAGSTDHSPQGFDFVPAQPLETIDDIVADMLDKQARLSAILDQ